MEGELGQPLEDTDNTQLLGPPSMDDAICSDTTRSDTLVASPRKYDSTAHPLAIERELGVTRYQEIEDDATIHWAETCSSADWTADMRVCSMAAPDAEGAD